MLVKHGCVYQVSLRERYRGREVLTVSCTNSSCNQPIFINGVVLFYARFNEKYNHGKCRISVTSYTDVFRMCHTKYITAFVAAVTSTDSHVNEDSTAGPSTHVSTATTTGPSTPVSAAGKTSTISLQAVTTPTNDVSKGNVGK